MATPSLIYLLVDLLRVSATRAAMCSARSEARLSLETRHINGKDALQKEETRARERLDRSMVQNETRKRRRAPARARREKLESAQRPATARNGAQRLGVAANNEKVARSQLHIDAASARLLRDCAFREEGAAAADSRAALGALEEQRRRCSAARGAACRGAHLERHSCGGGRKNAGPRPGSLGPRPHSSLPAARSFS